MGWFSRRKGLRRHPHVPDSAPAGNASTFIEATGGGWGDPPELMADDGGPHADYVNEQLALARAYAQEHVAIGQPFEFTISNIPRGIATPHDIVFGIMFRAGHYGFWPGAMTNETITLTRLN